MVLQCFPSAAWIVHALATGLLTPPPAEALPNMKRIKLPIVLLVSLLLPAWSLAETPFASVEVDPATLHLTGPNAKYTLLVHGKTADGGVFDQIYQPNQ